MSIEYTDEFLAFYETYPRHEGKADGQKAWNGLTKTQQAAAFADVEKRKRFGAYSSNKKKIQLPASYLRSARWDDDWEDTLASSRSDDDKPNSGAYIPRPSEPLPEIPWPERMINRLYVFWQGAVLGVDCTEPALDIKKAMLADDVPAYLEDVAAGKTTKDQAAAELAEAFLSRLDLHYGKTAKNRVLRTARRRA